MAIGDSYSTPAALADRLGIPDPADGTLEALLDAASKAVEQWTGRQFNAAVAASPRSFRPLDYQRLPVDDFFQIVDLAVVDPSGNAVDSAAYQPRPPDGIVAGQPGWPFSDLMRLTGCWRWDRVRRYEVTAWWGWSAVPEAIVQTTLNVAARLYREAQGSAAGPVRSESIDGYSVSFAIGAEQVTSLVSLSTFSLAAPYRRKTFGVA